MNSEELAYTAGIIDGEGYIVLSPRNYVHPKYGTYRRYNCIIGVKHTKRQLMDWLQQRFGGAIYNCKRHSESHSQTWDWKVTHLAAAAFAEKIRPYMLLKRRHIELVLEIQSGAKKWGKAGIPQDILDRREAIYNEMRTLNRRGSNERIQCISDRPAESSREYSNAVGCEVVYG